MTYKSTIKYSPYDDLFELFLIDSLPGEKSSRLVDFIFYDSQVGISAPTPPKVSREFLQSIMDGAWDAGFRPTAFKDVSQVLQAKDDHILDLRRIAMHTLKVPSK